MSTARLAIIVVCALALIACGIIIFRYGGSYQAASGLNSGENNCEEGYSWNGSACVVPGDGGANNGTGHSDNGQDDNNSGNDTSAGNNASTGGNTSSDNTTSNGNTSSNSTNTGSGNTSGNSTGRTRSSGSGSTGSTSQAPSGDTATAPVAPTPAVKFTGYTLTKSPFADLAQGGFSQSEMSWLGSEMLRTLIRANWQGRTYLNKSDLVWIAWILRESRTGALR
jgi:hypothetical protein